MAVLIDDFCRSRYEEPSAKPRPRPQGAEHRQPCALRKRRTIRTGSGAHHRNRAVAKNALRVLWRTRHPIDRVLEDARNGVVVLRAYEQQAIGGRDTILQLLN